MLKNNEAYLCLSAMLRSRETKLLTNERAWRMLDAPSFEEAAKLITDCGYEDMSQMNAKEIESYHNKRKVEIYKDLERFSPDSEIIDIFKMKYDYHNVKVILKAEAMNTQADRLLSQIGRISADKLKSLYDEGKFNLMPGTLGPAMAEAKEILARTENPQEADFFLDEAYFSEVLETANKSGNDFLISYAKLLIDAANLKSAVRTMRMGKNSEFMNLALIDGGNVGTKRISAADKDSIAALYENTALSRAAVLGGEAVNGAPLTAFELACDNAVNKYLSEAKLVSYGSEPLTAYLAAIESETTAVRMILTGRLAGIESAIIKERLRDMYA